MSKRGNEDVITLSSSSDEDEETFKSSGGNTVKEHKMKIHRTNPKKSKPKIMLPRPTAKTNLITSLKEKGRSKRQGEFSSSLHETSTSEIDSDEPVETGFIPAKPSSSQRNSGPLLSEAANRLFSRPTGQIDSDDDDEELPDLDYNYGPSVSSKGLQISYITPSTSTGKTKDLNSKTSINGDSQGASTNKYSQQSSGHSDGSQQSSQSNGKSKKLLQKEESERKREEKRMERERKNEQLAREKELKKSENELRKNMKPGEAHKFMTILIDDNFPYKTDLTLVLEELGVNHEMQPHSLVPNSFLFRRELIFRAMGDDLNLHKVSKFEEENQIMVFLNHEDIVPQIAIQISENGAPVPGFEDEIDFITSVKSIASTNPSKKVTLFLYGMENYFKKLKKNTQQEFRQRVLNGDKEKRSRKKKNQLPVISRLEFQSALVQLQLETNINFRLVNSIKELATILVQYTKSIAEAPFKQQRKEQGFDWYATADTAGSVKVEKDGTGLARLWLEQLCLFPNCGNETALAICTKYPSPQHLIQAYDHCDTQADGEILLRDLKMRMGVGPLAKTRKVGPELSKKLYRFFTSSDAERNLGSSQNI